MREKARENSGLHRGCFECRELLSGVKIFSRFFQNGRVRQGKTERSTDMGRDLNFFKRSVRQTKKFQHAQHLFIHYFSYHFLQEQLTTEITLLSSVDSAQGIPSNFF